LSDLHLFIDHDSQQKKGTVALENTYFAAINVSS